MSLLVIDGVIEILDLSGPPGPAGPPGADGAPGAPGDPGEDGESGLGLPLGGTVGQALLKNSAADGDASWGLIPATILETVWGGAGFIGVSGNVELDFDDARAFHLQMNGNINSLTFNSVPDSDSFSATWSIALRINTTGGYTVSGLPAVTWIDGSSWNDLNLAANAVNLLTLWQVGSTIYGAIVFNGLLELESHKLSFDDNGSQLIVFDRPQTLDLGNVVNVEADGTAGTGTLTYQRNGTTVSGVTSFSTGQVLRVTLASSVTPTAVGIPRVL